MTNESKTDQRTQRRSRIIALVAVFCLLLVGTAAVSWQIGHTAGKRDAMEQQCAANIMQLHLFRRHLDREEYEEAMNAIHRNMWANLKCLDLYADERRSDRSVLQVRDMTEDYLSELYGDQPP